MAAFSALTPWEDIIICKEAPEDVTEQGVVIAGGDEKKKPEKGIVVAVGPLSEKKKLPVDLRPGDLIFYERYTSNIISDAGTDYNFVRVRYIMGVKKKQ